MARAKHQPYTAPVVQLTTSDNATCLERDCTDAGAGSSGAARVAGLIKTERCLPSRRAHITG
eukprot:13548977-Alexandrium_andersonii.AAC.1